MANLRIDYDMTIARANKIKELSGNVKNIANNVRNVETETESCWKGEAAGAYRNQCEILEKHLYNVETKMNALAETIIRIADSIKAADEASAEMAQSLGN